MLSPDAIILPKTNRNDVRLIFCEVPYYGISPHIYLIKNLGHRDVHITATMHQAIPDTELNCHCALSALAVMAP